VWIIKQWRLVHPAHGERNRILAVNIFDEALLEAMKKEGEIRSKVILEIEQKIVGDKLAEIAAIFYLGRDRTFPEYYETLVDKKKKEQAASNNARAEIARLIDKTNFLGSVRMAAQRIGRLSLATQLATL
jgi:hypothetical protein